VSRPNGPDRVGWPCACGCLERVPPFMGKGKHARRYATPACGARVRYRKWLASNRALGNARSEESRKKARALRRERMAES